MSLGEMIMIRCSNVAVLLCVMGCADSPPDPQKVIEDSRRITVKAEKTLKEAKQSLEDANAKFDAAKQTPPAAIDLH